MQITGRQKIGNGYKNLAWTTDIYSNVIIFTHKTRDESRLEACFRTIVNAVWNDKLQMSGGSIVRKTDGQAGHGQTQAGRGDQG